MAKKAYKSALFAHVFGKFAEGAQRGMERKQERERELSNLVAKYAMEQHLEDQKRRAGAFDDYVALRKASATVTRPKIDPTTGAALLDPKTKQPVYESFDPIPEPEVQQGINYLRGINPEIPEYAGKGEKPGTGASGPKSPPSVVIERLSAARAALGVIERLEKSYEDIPENFAGQAYQGTVGALTGGRFGTENAKFYQDFLKSNLSLIAKGVKREAGNLAAQDYVMAEAGFPKVGPVSDQKKLGRAKIAAMKKQVVDSITDLERGNYTVKAIDGQEFVELGPPTDGATSPTTKPKSNPNRIAELLSKPRLTPEELKELMEYDASLGGGR